MTQLLQEGQKCSNMILAAVEVRVEKRPYR